MTTYDVPKDAAKRRHWVIYQLRVRGTNLRRFAFQIGVSQQAVSAALFSPSSYIETALAKELGLKPQQLFPERFDSAGRRLHATRSPQRSRAPLGRNVQVPGVA
ncbi:helix-turn-helix domain-containing protein [Dongia deserti]|uniref:helix-turn-helix domain-containing protein n=1 Tax=Dongia deserti TaxID=2268030 RepID=UPI0013C40CB7|nr:helix-turn-helix domain-containing protein [Dongia deserti]